MSNKNEYMKKYNSRPDVKEKRKQYMKEFYSKPENIQKKKQYMLEYNSREEVKAKKKKEGENRNYKEYYAKNKEKISLRRKSSNYYLNSPESRKKKQDRDSKYYAKNHDLCRSKEAEKRKIRKEKIDAIAIHYGCRNPECMWKSTFKAHQLDFHHLDPSTKYKEIGKIYYGSIKKLSNEINKCVILCRNCHALLWNQKLNLTSDLLCKVDEKLNIL